MLILGFDRSQSPASPPGLIVRRDDGTVVRLDSDANGVRVQPYPLHDRQLARMRRQPDPCPGFEPCRDFKSINSPRDDAGASQPNRDLPDDGRDRPGEPDEQEQASASWFVEQAGELAAMDPDVETVSEVAAVFATEIQPVAEGFIDAVFNAKGLASVMGEIRRAVSPAERLAGLRIQQEMYDSLRNEGHQTAQSPGHMQTGVPEVDRILASGHALLASMINPTEVQP